MSDLIMPIATIDGIDYVVGQTQEDVERTMRDGFIAIRDDSGHLLMRYNPAKNLIEIQRRGVKSSIYLGKFWESAMSDRLSDDMQKKFTTILLIIAKHYANVELSRRLNHPIMVESVSNIDVNEAIAMVFDIEREMIRLQSATSAAQGGADGRLTND